MVSTAPDGAPSVVEVATGDPVRLEGAPHHFRLGGWAGDSVFFGVGTDAAGRARHIVRCDVGAGTCRFLDRVGPGPVVFGTGR